jgi:hypothetical protein
MPLEKKLEILRKYNPTDYYEEGRFIDAQDTVNSWCLAQIVNVDNKNLNIHFDGWSSRWDVVSFIYTVSQHDLSSGTK